MTAAGAGEPDRPDKGSQSFTGPLRCTVPSGLRVNGTPGGVHPEILFVPVSVSWRLCGIKSQASKINSSNNFTFSRYHLFSSFNTYNTLGPHLPCGLQRKSPLGNTTKFLTSCMRQGGQAAGSLQSEILFFLSQWAEFAQDVENLPDFLATNQLILMCLFLRTEAEVLAGFQKSFQLLDCTDLQATESRPKPTQASPGTCALTQAAKAMNLNGLFQ